MQETCAKEAVCKHYLPNTQTIKIFSMVYAYSKNERCLMIMSFDIFLVCFLWEVLLGTGLAIKAKPCHPSASVVN